VSLQAALKEVQARPVVRLLFELERAAVLHELSELTGVSTAQLLQARLNLLLLDVVVLLVLGATREALPWQLALDQVEEHVTNRFKVIPSRLLDALVCGNRSIPSRSSQVLAILVGDVLDLAVLVALGEAEIDDVDAVTG